MKKWLMVVGLICLLLVGLFFWGTQRVEHQLRERGWSWEETHHGVVGLEWQNLVKDKNRIGALTIRFLPSIDITIQDAMLSPGKSDGGGFSKGFEFAIHGKNISLQFEGAPMLSGFEGEISPEISLSNGQDTLQRQGEKIHLVGTRQLALPHLQGEIQFDLHPLEDGMGFSLQSKQLILQHPFLQAKPLEAINIQLKGTWDGDIIEALMIWEENEFGIYGNLSVGGESAFIYNLQIEANNLPVAELMAPFDIPVQERQRVSGELFFTLNIQGPPLTQRADIRFEKLTTDGRLVDPQSFQRGDFPFKPLNATKYQIIGPRSPHWVPISAMGWMPKTTVAAEDSKFHTHPGVDMEQLHDAFASFQLHGSAPQSKGRGGSTITQQLAKNLFLNADRTVQRKLRELLYTVELEKVLTKDKILELYLNIVEFGPGIYGIKQASETYFLKSPSKLTLKEAAYLAAVLPAPARYFKEIQADQNAPNRRINAILTNMLDGKQITAFELNAAIASPLRVVPPPL